MAARMFEGGGTFPLCGGFRLRSPPPPPPREGFGVGPEPSPVPWLRPTRPDPSFPDLAPSVELRTGSIFNITTSGGASVDPSTDSGLCAVLSIKSASITMQPTVTRAVKHAGTAFGVDSNFLERRKSSRVDRFTNGRGSLLKSFQLVLSSFFRNASWIASLLTKDRLSIIVGWYS